MCTQVRTSDSHPIEVFWVDDKAHNTSGRLGLTFAPGKCGAGLVAAARWERSLDADLDRLKDHHGTGRLVSLMEPFEYDMLKIPGLCEEAEQRGMRVHHLSIVDTSVPIVEQAAEVDKLVLSIHDALRAGKRVVVHCRGGQGRTGTIASIVLTTFGHGPEEAILLVRDAQPRAVENFRQQEYVREASRRLENVSQAEGGNL